ncbi:MULTISPECIES: SDR family NAD(P)-dependent oxidoreductase [unclassified Chryseobacterium]|jgi:short-subunit dehydrogenase|uniref:SDR family NAD(P)-dependent oxidoreductase n=1 Tax=unclassified Chryseobacterium TaxID=2593645 RepID=UPI0021E5CAE1|nr:MULTISPECIES: SDR family oxidoreductase [unclassified Chryseobacterium]MEA1848507.1 SDR family oxidoreductase [Chryseobacterium sp. MHB01]
MNRKNEYALVTGATSGIGYELAKQFASNGYDLVMVARNHDELKTRADEFKSFGINVITIAKNLFIEEDAYSLYSELKLNGISPSILVNDAGQGVYGKFQDTDLHREVDIVNLNIVSVLILTKMFLKDRLPKGSGKILNLASIASKAPGPWHSVYHGTKAFILSWSEAIREELKDTGITVTALLPGPTDTDFFNKADMNESKILEDKDNLASPEEVAIDGFNALMNGDDKVVSGLKNKLTVAMSNIATDSMAAHRMGEMQKPVNEK